MVQILPPVDRGPSFGERLGVGLGAGVSQGVRSGLARRQKLSDLKEENEAAKRMGLDLSGVIDPDIRKSAFSEHFKAKEKSQEGFSDLQENMKNYKTIQERFGRRNAELWLAAPEGGKTKLIQYLLDQESRSSPLGSSQQDQFDQGIYEEEISPEMTETPEVKEMSPSLPKIDKSFVDYDKGKTPHERYQSQENRYKTNLPLYEESFERRRALDTEAEKLGILEDLSPKIGAIERLNINPVSGELIIPGLASADAQRFVKTVNDFTTNAKDSYGARVTNFDLQQFMRRLPTLANTEEGRRQIIEQMKIINDINRSYETSLQQNIEKHGGVRFIDYDVAQRMAEKQSKSKAENLRKKFTSIGAKQEKIYQKGIDEIKKMVPNGYVGVQNADGTQGWIPKDQLKEFLADDPNNSAL